MPDTVEDVNDLIKRGYAVASMEKEGSSIIVHLKNVSAGKGTRASITLHISAK